MSDKKNLADKLFDSADNALHSAFDKADDVIHNTFDKIDDFVRGKSSEEDNKEITVTKNTDGSTTVHIPK